MKKEAFDYKSFLIFWGFFTFLFLLAFADKECFGVKGIHLCEASFDEEGHYTPWAIVYGGIYCVVFGGLMMVMGLRRRHISVSSALLSLAAAVGFYTLGLVVSRLLLQDSLEDAHVTGVMAGLFAELGTFIVAATYDR